MHKIIIISSLFFQLESCPFDIWYDRFGDPSNKEPLSEFVLKLQQDGNVHEEEYLASLEYVRVTENSPEAGAAATLKLMKEGVSLIAQGWLRVEESERIFQGRPDLLQRYPGNSLFGNWIYVPVDIKASSKVKPTHELQLALYAYLLEHIQGVRPNTGEVINRDFCRFEVLLNDRIMTKMWRTIEEITQILHGHRPPFHISSKTKNSAWFKTLLKEAEEADDISLIYGMHKDSAQHLRQLGITTVKKLAEVDIKALPKIRNTSFKILQRAQAQAQSLVEKRPIVIGKLSRQPQAALKIYFDIEGTKNPETDYLFGFWIDGDHEGAYASIGHVRCFKEDEGRYFIYFLTETTSSEEKLWEQFLVWIDLLPQDYTVYHYANYENAALKRLSKKYRSSSALKRFQERLVDLEKEVKKTVVLPLYFYSIKDIAKSPFVNFKWRHAKAGGAQSIFWYEQWLKTEDPTILRDIIDYNEDDVRATEAVYRWLTIFFFHHH